MTQPTEKSSSSTPSAGIPVAAGGGPNSRRSPASSARSSGVRSGSSQPDFAFSPDRTYSEDQAYCNGMAAFVLCRGYRLLGESYMRASWDVGEECVAHRLTCKGCKKCRRPDYKPRGRGGKRSK